MDSLYKNEEETNKKIFISHSSQDKPLIDAFIKDVLIATELFNRDEIAYSSGGDMGAEAGECILDYIHKNLEKSSLILLMISSNYKKSEICLNEMGAAWILNKEIVPVLLPNTSCENIGFLNDKNLAIDICSRDGLSKLVDRISVFSSRTSKHETVTKEIENFIKKLGNYSSGTDTCIKNHFSMQDIKQDAAAITDKIKRDNFSPSLILGIGRGGAIFGSLISYNLYHAPIFTIDRQYNWDGKRIDGILFDIDIPAQYLDNVLLVAGETHSGNTLELFRNFLYSKGSTNVKTCVYYKQGVTTCLLDYYSREGIDTPLMPWQDKDYIRDSINAVNFQKLQESKKLHNSLKDKTIYIVRHGETQLNKEDKFIGSTEVSLSQTGIDQAKSVGKFLKDELGNVKIKIYSSNQNRCKETSDYISSFFKSSDCVTDDRLRERDYGDWEEKSRKWLKRNQSKDYNSYENNPILFSPDNAESVCNVIKRVNEIWKEIAKDDAENIIIVTHKTTGRILITLLENGYYTQYRDVPFANGSLFKFTIKDHEIKLDFRGKQFV